MKNQIPPEKTGKTILPWLIAILFLLAIGGWYLLDSRRPASAPVNQEGPVSTLSGDFPEPVPDPEVPGTPTPSFLDDFEDGLDPVWTVHYGDPFVVDGRLTSNVGAGMSAGDGTWRNYRVDLYVDATQADCAFTENSNSIGVRAADFDHAYWFVFTACETSWSLFPGGVLRGEANMFPDTRLGTTNKTKNITIRVEDTEMSVYEDGLLLSSIEDSSFEMGGVFVQIEAGTFYDDFQVTLLP